MTIVIFGVKTMVFDLEADPEERNDISRSHPKVTRNLLETIQDYKHKRPYQPRYWMVNPNWTDSFVPGDCSNQPLLSSSQCKFAHHWLDDSADLRDETLLGLENDVDRSIALLRNALACLVLACLLMVFLVFKLCSMAFRRGRKEKKN